MSREAFERAVADEFSRELGLPSGELGQRQIADLRDGDAYVVESLSHIYRGWLLYAQHHKPE